MEPVNIYLSYAHEDESLTLRLKQHLRPLTRQKLITILDEPVLPGSAWQFAPDNNINKADIIIPLISSSFLASDYMYSIEMQRALERHKAGEAHVIPVILRPVAWQGTPFDHLKVLPANGRAITRWASLDEALLNVVEGILEAVERISKQRLAPPSVTETRPEKVIAALPSTARDAVKSGRVTILKEALEEYHDKHPNERLVIPDNETLLYYDNVVQVAYIWQIWQTLIALVSVQEKTELFPLFEELLKALATSLNTTTGTNILPTRLPTLFYTSLSMQQVFANLRIPKQMPIIFYAGSSFDMKQIDELRYLMKKISPSSRVAILLLFVEQKYLRDCLKFLRHFQQAFSYDIIPMDCNDLLKITEARDPRKLFRQWILSQFDLSIISPFTTSGPTPDGMFFGREQELRTIQERVGTSSYALIGGRRIGKTSLMRRLWRISLPEAGMRAFYQDCSFIQTPAQLIQAIGLSWFPKVSSLNLSTFAEVVQALPDDKPLVFLFDEADKLIEPDKAAGYPLLNTLRALANAGRCQFVFSGEYALRSDMQNPRSPLYNFATELLIGHLDARAVRELIVHPMHDLEIELEDEDKIVGRIWEFTAGHPNVIQRLCQHLVKEINGSRLLRLSINDVEEILTNTDFLRKDFLDTYWGQATLLERLCTLVMAKRHDIQTLVEIHAALVDLDPSLTLDDVNEALGRLVDLRNLLRRTTQGYVFVVKDFPAVIAKTYVLDDLIALTSDKYKREIGR